MTANQWPTLIAIALVIIAALGGYAFVLLRRLRQQTQQQELAQQQQLQALHQHDQKVLDSVVIIVRAMKEEQCDLSEGCWRLSVLLDSLKTSQDLNVQFPAIFELYEAIKHMPIREARKQLTKQQRMKLDLERTKTEARLQADVFNNLQLLHNYAIERISFLSR